MQVITGCGCFKKGRGQFCFLKGGGLHCFRRAVGENAVVLTTMNVEAWVMLTHVLPLPFTILK